MEDWHEPVEERDRGAVAALQMRRLKAVLEAAASGNPFYRAHWKGADVAKIDSLESFAERIPTVEKRDFIADQEDAPPYGLRHAPALALGRQLHLSTTSGTTGQGVEVHLQTDRDMRGTEAISFHMYRWSGLKPGALTFLTMPVTMLAGGRLEFMAAAAYGLSVSPVGNYDAGRKLELMRRFRPKALIGTTSYFGHLAAVAPEWPPSPGLTHLFSGAESSGWSYFERLEQDWGARVFDRYGSTQAGCDHMFGCRVGIGTRARPGMLHNVDHLMLVEVIDPATGRQVKDGEPGEIVLTSLAHLDVPLVRCRMRDVAVWREPRSCACGLPFAGVEIASFSRLDDVKKVKGINVWPQAVEDVLFAEPLVEEYQVVLASSSDESDVAMVRIMPERALGDGEAEALALRLVHGIRARIGIRFEVETVAPGALPRSEYKARRWRDERVHQRDRRA